MRVTISIILFVVFLSGLDAATYYVSPTGDDNNSGLSTVDAFQSLAKINSLILMPGDQVLLEGGASFMGSLMIQYSGTALDPILISSYNTGVATIQFDNLGTGNVKAVELLNASHIIVKDLKISGDYFASTDGAKSPATANVGLVSTARDADVENIRIDNVEVTHFTWGGIRLESFNGYKVSDASILNCDVHDNGFVGIATRSRCVDILIADCKSYNNTGWTATPAGSGIHLSGAEDVIVEYCEAYNNGGNNANISGGGGCGIWASNSSDVHFRYNESHHNATMWADGCGFDIDGGVVNAIMEYNYAHDNFGAGFLIFQYDNSPTQNVTVRYNISENDGTWHKQGAITLHRASALTTPTTDIFVYNNTIFNNDNLVPLIEVNDGSGAFDFENVNVYNNLYVQPNGGLIYKYLNGATANTGGNYHDPTDGNSLLTDPGQGGTIGDPTMLSTLTAYHALIGSPVINEGLDLTAQGIVCLSDMGSRDFYNNVIPQDGVYDIGAYEYSNSCPETELLDQATFDVSNANSIPGWTVNMSNGIVATSGINNSDEVFFDITDGGSQNYNIQLWQDNLAIENNGLYVIKVNMRAAVNRTVRLIVRKRTSAYFYLDHTFEVRPVSDEYVLAFVSPEDDSDIRLSLQVGGDDGDVFVDDISFYKDCDDVLTSCVDYLSYLGNEVLPSIVYKAKTEIVTNGQILQDSTVNLKSGGNVNMLPLFEIDTGGTLIADVEVCN